MKNILLTFVAILLFFSCKNSLDIQSRRYTKGLYVSLAKKRTVNRQQKDLSQKFINVKKYINVNEISSNIILLPLINTASNSTIDHINTKKSLSAGVSEIRYIQKNSAYNLSLVINNSNIAPRKKWALEKLSAADVSSCASGPDESTMFVVMLILCLIPPLAVYLKEKACTKWFWWCTILCLLSLLGIGYTAIFGLWFIATIISLCVVLDILN